MNGFLIDDDFRIEQMLVFFFSLLVWF